MRSEGGPVDRAASDEPGRCGEQDEVYRAARIAQVSVRDKRDQVQWALPPEHASAKQDEPGVLEHAELPPVFVGDVAGRLLPGDRLRVDDRATASLSEEIWENDVVPEPRIEFQIVGAAYGIDGPDPSGDRPDPRFVPPQPAFEARIQPFSVGARRPARRNVCRRRTQPPGRRNCGRACAAHRAASACSHPRMRGLRCSRLGRRNPALPSCPRVGPSTDARAYPRLRTPRPASSVRSVDPSETITISSL